MCKNMRDVEESVNFSTFYISIMFPKCFFRLMSNTEEHMNIEEYMWNVEKFK